MLVEITKSQLSMRIRAVWSKEYFIIFLLLFWKKKYAQTELMSSLIEY